MGRKEFVCMWNCRADGRDAGRMRGLFCFRISLAGKLCGNGGRREFRGSGIIHSLQSEFRRYAYPRHCRLARELLVVCHKRAGIF